MSGFSACEASSFCPNRIVVVVIGASAMICLLRSHAASFSCCRRRFGRKVRLHLVAHIGDGGARIGPDFPVLGGPSKGIKPLPAAHLPQALLRPRRGFWV